MRALYVCLNIQSLKSELKAYLAKLKYGIQKQQQQKQTKRTDFNNYQVQNVPFSQLVPLTWIYI